MKFPIVLILLFSSSFAQAMILVTFGGLTNHHNNGPFNGPVLFSGSFKLDESVVATVNGTKFEGAVDDLRLNIDDFNFTGNNGYLRQITNPENTRDLMEIIITDLNGDISPGGAILTKVRFDWRGIQNQNLFLDSSVIASDLITSDFNYRKVEFWFDNSSSNTVIDFAQQINFGTASPVPVPAAVWLFGSGLLGLFGFSKKKRS